VHRERFDCKTSKVDNANASIIRSVAGAESEDSFSLDISERQIFEAGKSKVDNARSGLNLSVVGAEKPKKS
jgi:hypothetical protein